MEIKPIVAALIIFTFGLALADDDPCASDEMKNVHACLLEFVMAHRQHQAELVTAADCKLQLLNCSALDAAYKCLNGHRLPVKCIDSLEDTINKYIADLQIKCTVSQFNSHCPDITQIRHTDPITSTTISPSSSSRQQSMWILTTALFLIATMFMK